MRHAHWEEKISALVDNELEEGPAQAVKDHMDRCPSCRGFYSSAVSLTAVLAGLKPAETPEPRKIRLNSADYYRVIPERTFTFSLRPSYAFAAAAAMIVCALLLYKVYTGPAAGTGPLETYLAEGTLTIDTSASQRHIVVVTPWAKIVPEGTIFTVTQEPEFLHVAVAEGRVLVFNLLKESEKIEVSEKQKFVMDKTGAHFIEKIARVPDMSGKRKIGIERWREK